MGVRGWEAGGMEARFLKNSFIRGSSAPRSSPLPLYIPRIWYPFLTYLQNRNWMAFQWVCSRFLKGLAKWKISLHFSVLQLVKSLLSYIPLA